MICYGCRCFRFRFRFLFLSFFFLLTCNHSSLPTHPTLPSPFLVCNVAVVVVAVFFSFFSRSLSRKIQQGKKTAVPDLFRIVMERIVES